MLFFPLLSIENASKLAETTLHASVSAWFDLFNLQLYVPWITMTDGSDEIAHNRLLPPSPSFFPSCLAVLLFGSIQIWFACQNCLIRNTLRFELTHSCSDFLPSAVWTNAMERLLTEQHAALSVPRWLHFYPWRRIARYFREVWGYICQNRSPLDVWGYKYRPVSLRICTCVHNHLILLLLRILSLTGAPSLSVLFAHFEVKRTSCFWTSGEGYEYIMRARRVSGRWHSMKLLVTTAGWFFFHLLLFLFCCLRKKKKKKHWSDTLGSIRLYHGTLSAHLIS